MTSRIVLFALIIFAYSVNAADMYGEYGQGAPMNSNEDVGGAQAADYQSGMGGEGEGYAPHEHEYAQGDVGGAQAAEYGGNYNEAPYNEAHSDNNMHQHQHMMY